MSDPSVVGRPPRGVTVPSGATTTDRADRILFGSIVPVNPNAGITVNFLNIITVLYDFALT